MVITKPYSKNVFNRFLQQYIHVNFTNLFARPDYSRIVPRLIILVNLR